jgi:hypothetical protein
LLNAKRNNRSEEKIVRLSRNVSHYFPVTVHRVSNQGHRYTQSVCDYRVLQMRERGLSAILRYANRPMTKQMLYPVIAYTFPASVYGNTRFIASCRP